MTREAVDVGCKEGVFTPLEDGVFHEKQKTSKSHVNDRADASLRRASQERSEDSEEGANKRRRGKMAWLWCGKGKGGEAEGKEKGPPPVAFHQLFRFATKWELAFIFLAVVAASITGVCMPVLLILYGELTDVLIDHQMSLESENSTQRLPLDSLHLLGLRTFKPGPNEVRNILPNDPDTFLANVGAFSIGCATLGLIQLVCDYIFVTSLNYTAENQILRIRTLFLQSVLRQDIAWYDTHQIGDFASRVTEDLNKLKDGIGEKVGMVVLLFVSFLSSIVVSFIYGWKLTLVILSIMPVLVIATAIVGKMQATLTEKELKAYGKAGAVSEEALGALRTVLAFGGEQKEVERFKTNLMPACNAGKKRGMFLGLGNGIMWLITYVSYSIAFYYGVYLILEDRGKPDPEYTAASMVIRNVSQLKKAWENKKARRKGKEAVMRMGTGGGPYTPSTDPYLEIAVPSLAHFLHNTGDNDQVFDCPEVVQGSIEGDLESHEVPPERPSSPIQSSILAPYPSTSVHEPFPISENEFRISAARMPYCTSNDQMLLTSTSHHPIPSAYHSLSKITVIEKEYEEKLKKMKIVNEGEEEIWNLRKEAALIELYMKKVELEKAISSSDFQKKIIAIDLRNKMEEYELSRALFGVLTGAMNMGQASPYLEAFSIARGAAATVYAVIDRIPKIDSLSGSGASLSTVIGAISFEGVQFSYPSRPDVKILQGLSFKINRGETVALVGHSGCGKSTCIQLIQRFYDPLHGTVRLDGIDIKSLNVCWLRSQIGVVGQEPVLFGASIADNIRYGKECVTQEEIVSAAKEANAHDFIMKLPERYETLVGERGAQLSGGQKQRIAIARALVRKPVVLLLDEATSALDTGSEAMVQAALDKASKGRTTVIVAHRLSTIRGADKILVLSAGQLVEEGSHEQLMSQRGHYYQLVMAQLEGVLESSQRNEDAENLKGADEKRLVGILRRQSDLVQEKDDDGHRSTRGSVQVQWPAQPKTKPAEEEFEEAPLGRILSMNSPEWALIISGSIGAILVGCSMPTFAVLFGDLYGVLSLSDPEEVRSESSMYSVFFLITGIVTGVAAFLQMFSFNLAGVKLTNRLRLLSFAAIMRQEVAWFDDERNSVGALCSRLSGDAASVQGATGSRIGAMLQAFSTLVLGIVLSLIYDWKLGLVTATSIPIVLAAVYFEGIITRVQSLNDKKALESSTKIAVEAIGNIRTVASLGLEGQFMEAYVQELTKPHISAKQKTHLRGLVFGLGQSVPFVVYAGSLYYGGYLIATEGLHYKQVIKVSEALIYGTMMLGQALAFAPNFNQAKVSASKIFALLDRKPQISTLDVKPDPKWKVEGNIDFSEVQFEYPSRPGVRILRGLDLNVLAGKTVALVGSSGCGKSTCIQLLQRFYEPMAGTVSLDSTDISTLALETLRKQMGIVSQEPVLFDLSIEQNIAYGDHSRDVAMDEIIDAAKKANIHNFITSLPLGYETCLGEKGTQLSGGQKQRIAIARALIRNPRILLLDEATSALDTQSEKVVQEALDKAREGRTVLTIAHRLSTVSSADVICVIKDGRVAELGDHQKLISLKGLYYQLHSAHGIVKGDEKEE